jgi:hypothetical protein
VPAYDRIASTHITQFAADGVVAFDGDHGVHALPLHFRPPAGEPHVRATVRGAVKVVGNAAVHLCALQSGIALADGMTAE